MLSSPAQSTKQGNDVSVIVHRFKTQLSTLLQDRTVEGRWAAVVLVKATIEAGGVEVLSKSNAWVRNLLGILKKPDPPTTRLLAVIALTRMFMLTWDYSSLIREITTPALPTFVTTCLNNAENKRCSADELSTMLEAFTTLIPRHPNIFRTSETQIRSLLTRILSTTPSNGIDDSHYTRAHQSLAQRLLVLLHHCASKQGSADKWDETLKATVIAGHATCDRLFRSIVEDWQSAAGVRPSALPNTLLRGEMELESIDSLGLSGWKGVDAGSERLVSQLDMITKHMDTATTDSVTVRLGLISDLLIRVLSLRVPYGKHNSKPSVQIAADERETLFSVLPSVHVAALRLVRSIPQRFGVAIVAIVLPLLNQITWVFEAEHFDIDLRAATYMVMTSLLQLQGPSMAKEDVTDIEQVVRVCCQDLLPADDSAAPQAKGAPGKQLGATSDLGMQATKIAASSPMVFARLHATAEALLPVCISKLDPSHVPGRLRALMERTAVLAQHKDALVACVINPAMKGKGSSVQPSLLPLLAKQFSDTPEVEALLRPRMPFIRTGANRHDEDEVDGSHEDADEYAEMGEMGGDNVNAINGAENGNGLTGSLSSAFGQHDPATSSGDLYSGSLPHQTDHATMHDAEASVEKRKADAAPDFERSAKRAQVPPAAEVLPETIADDSPGTVLFTVQRPDLDTTTTEAPQSSFVTAPEPSQQGSALPAVQVQASTNAVSQIAADDGDDGDDGSDFEMPPLTMDASDDEEESEDDEE